MKSVTMDLSPSRARSVMTLVLLALGLLCLALAADSMVTTLATAAESHTLSLTGRDVAVWNLAGKARLEAGSGGEVRVTVNQLGPDADQLKLEQSPIRGRTALRVRYPGNRVVYPEMGRGSSTSVRVRGDGTFGGDNDHGWPSGDNVRITGSGSGVEAHADLDIAIPRGQKFSLYLATGAVTVTNVDGELRVDTGSGTVSSTHTSGDLSIDTGSGEIDVGDAEGTVNLDTGSGDVNVSGVHGDVLNVDTGSGAVRARDVVAGEVMLDTGSGEVEAANVKADRIKIDTGSGSVDLGLGSGARSIAVDTGSGDVTLRVPSTFGGDISFETGSGGFDYEGLPVTLRKLESGSYRGQVGDGSARVVIETGSGNFRLASNGTRYKSR